MEISQISQNAMRREVADTAAAENRAAQSIRSGEIMGEEIQWEIDESAFLEDSLEEISAAFEEQTTKTMGQRKLGEKRMEESRFDSKVSFWVEKLPDMPGGEKLLRLARRLDKESFSQQELMEELRKLSGDPTHQFAILDILEELFRNRDDAAAKLALLRQVREQLNQEQGPAIRAGLNLAEALKEAGTPPERMQQMRDLYRSEVLGFSTPQECFRSLMARGQGTLTQSLDFLLASCHVDMEAATPSMPPEQLRRILLDLQCVNVLRLALERFEGLDRRMLQQFGAQLLLNGEAMTGRMMDFTEMNFIDSGVLAAFIGECGVKELLAKLDFMRETFRIFRGLSLRLFRNEESRSRLLEASQECLDALIAEDEKQHNAEDAIRT